MMAETIKPIDVTAEEIAEGLAAIAEVPTGGHFFGTQHTLARYETAFYQPLVSDWQNYENWELAGGLDATKRATRIWQAALDAYQPPPMDPAITEALDAYVAHRKEALKDVDH
jgi:trimethylamine--corrinoid protein Co-methyltransferase